MIIYIYQFSTPFLFVITFISGSHSTIKMMNMCCFTSLQQQNHAYSAGWGGGCRFRRNNVDTDMKTKKNRKDIYSFAGSNDFIRLKNVLK